MREKAAFVVLARLASTRLPRKALLDLGGMPIIQLAIERLRRSKHLNQIILATTTSPEDDLLADFAKDLGVTVFRGASEDVAGRCFACARQHRLEWFVRICGDSPFIDPEVVDRVIDRYLSERPDIATNVHPRSFPIGCSAEAISTTALQRLTITTKDLRYLEHVTAFFYENESMYQIENLHAGDDRYEGISIAVDTQTDYDRAAWVFEHLDDPVTASVDDVIEMADRWGGKS